MMNRYPKARWLVVVATALSLPPCVAQSDDSAPLLLELPANTRALSLGGAFVLGADASDAIFYNAGALINASGAGLGVQRYGSSSVLGNLSAVTEWSDGKLAFGVQAISYGSDVPWLDGIPDDANDLLYDSPVGVAEMIGSIGYARELFGFQVGVVGKAVEQRVGAGRDATGAADIGVVRELLGVTLGVSAQNLGPALRIGPGELPLPSRITLGGSSRTMPVGPLDLLVSMAVTRRRDGRVVPGGGIEISWWPIVGRTFIGRLGLRRVPGDGASPFTLGLGFRGDVVSVEYSFEDFDAPGTSHRFGLSWH